jgi:hypothetical protein
MMVTNKSKLTSKTIHVKIPAIVLADAFTELFQFNEKVDQIKVRMKRIQGAPKETIQISCFGRGKISGRVVDGTFHGVIKGTKRQVNRWERFFKKFVEVPEFSLQEYVSWLRNDNNHNP